MKFNNLPIQWNYNHPLRMRVIDYQKILDDNLLTEDEIKHNNAGHFFPPLKPDGTRTFQERQVLGLLESELYINRIIHSLSQSSDIKSFSVDLDKEKEMFKVNYLYLVLMILCKLDLQELDKKCKREVSDYIARAFDSIHKNILTQGSQEDILSFVEQLEMILAAASVIAPDELEGACCDVHVLIGSLLYQSEYITQDRYNQILTNSFDEWINYINNLDDQSPEKSESTPY